MPPRKSVLIIDDSDSHTQQLERGLRLALPGIGVVAKPGGDQALEHLALCGTRYPVPDLLVLDRSMPEGLCGFETLSRIRREFLSLALPVVMVSGSDSADHIAHARHAGADGYIVKPCTRDGYPSFAQDLLTRLRSEPQHGKKIERESNAELTLLTSPSRILEVSSPSMCHTLAAPQPNLIGQFLATAAAYFQRPDFDATALQGVFADQDELDITFAERQARITRRQVEDFERHSGHDMDLKRRGFFSALFQRGWGLSQVLERFGHFSEDYLKRIRAQVKKSGANRAPTR